MLPIWLQKFAFLRTLKINTTNTLIQINYKKPLTTLHFKNYKSPKLNKNFITH